MSPRRSLPWHTELWQILRVELLVELLLDRRVRAIFWYVPFEQLRPRSFRFVLRRSFLQKGRCPDFSPMLTVRC